MIQIIIAISGGLAIWLTQTKNFQRFAPIIGLIGQPFWFYSAFVTEQWGIFALTAFYTIAWFKGLKLHWGTSWKL